MYTLPAISSWIALVKSSKIYEAIREKWITDTDLYDIFIKNVTTDITKITFRKQLKKMSAIKFFKRIKL